MIFKKAMTETTLSTGLDSESLRVLLVDDHDDLLVMLQLVLSRRNYHVATASSGHEAIKIASDFAPHIIVSDLGMPGMNGYEMIVRLRAMNELGAFKAIALSGFDEMDDETSAIAAGFDAHVSKPIDFERLFATIDRLTN